MRKKAPLLDKVIAGLSLVGFGFMAIAVCRFFLDSGTILTLGFPSALLLAVVFLLPAIELRQYGHIKPLGKSFRAFVLLVLDRLLAGEQVFASVYWEIAAVGLALVLVFYLPVLWKMIPARGH